ncbi:MAG TPA: phosphatase PAP2 family protein [Polyangiaceae bacterium]|nr:phosphatase PAP2 family protein [Polyangiaceae bacterium]
MWQHMRRLWPKWTLLPVLPFWVWAGVCAWRGQLRWDHLVIAAVVSALAYGNLATRRLFLGLLPMGLVGLFYDAMRLVKNVGLTAENIHICDLRATELAWFGLTVGGERVTLHDWLQAHASLPLDVVAAVPYGTFLLAVVGYALFLFVRDFRSEQRFMWGFLALNFAGFLTYHLYPAAPPWYYHAHGCAADLSAGASAGPNLTRVDALLGIPYFAGFYGRSSDIFGAVPSLHVAYPLLMAIEGYRHHRAFGRTLLVAFYLWMCFAAVYLDHHWVIDILWGSAYTVAVAFLMRRLSPWVLRRFLPKEQVALGLVVGTEPGPWQS